MTLDPAGLGARGNPLARNQASFPASFTIAASQAGSALRQHISICFFAAFLVVMAGRAHGGEFYISDISNSTISKYSDAGDIISASLVSGLNQPYGLALSGNNLFVADFGHNRVGEYDAATGNPIDSSLVSTGTNTPTAVAISGGNLFVASVGVGGAQIGKFDATTGVGNGSFITGLNYPADIVVAGNYLYVSFFNNDSIGRYDVTTGLGTSSFISPVTGLDHPNGIAVSGNSLYVAIFADGTIERFDAATGALLNPSLVTGLGGATGLEIFGDSLYVGENSYNRVGRYDLDTGVAINADFITGTIRPVGIAVSSEVTDMTSTAPLVGLAILGLGFWARRREVEGRVERPKGAHGARIAVASTRQ